MAFKLTAADYVEYLEITAVEIEKSGDYVTALDAKTGDGDHWVNLNSGFQKVMSIKEELKTMELSPMLRKIGMTLMSGIGGSSGVLYGSGYIAASKALKDVDVLDIESLYSMLKAELDAIMDRGKAQPGWKTMIDSLYEGLESYKKAVDEGEDEKGVMEALKLGAQQGRDHTKEMEAVKGRASYQTNKGVGELDPGAVTMCIQLECLSDYVINKAL